MEFVYILFFIGLGVVGFIIRQSVLKRISKDDGKSSSNQKFLLFTAWFLMIIVSIGVLASATMFVNTNLPGIIMRQVGFLAGIPLVIWVVWGALILIRSLFRFVSSMF